MKIEQLETYLASLEKPHKTFRLSVEFGHILVQATTLEALGYEGQNGIKALLSYLVDLGWEGVMEGDKLIGARKSDHEWVSLGIGGQINWHYSDFIMIRDLDQAYLAFIEGLFDELKRRQSILLATGHQPVTKTSDLETMPMAHAKNVEIFAKDNTALLDYYKASCFMKVSLNYAHSDNFEKRFQAATIIYPALASLFANVAWYEGKPVDGLLFNINNLYKGDERLYHVEEALHNTFKYDAYAYFMTHALGIDKLEEDGSLTYVGDKELREVYDEMTEAMVKHSLNNVSPIVGVSEEGITINNIDAVPYPLNMAYVLLVKALLYNPDHMTAIQKMLEQIKEDGLLASRKEWLQKGIEAKLGEGSVYDMIKDIFFMVTLSIEPAEQHYIQPLNSLVFKNTKVYDVSSRQFENIVKQK